MVELRNGRYSVRFKTDGKYVRISKDPETGQAFYARCLTMRQMKKQEPIIIEAYRKAMRAEECKPKMSSDFDSPIGTLAMEFLGWQTVQLKKQTAYARELEMKYIMLMYGAEDTCETMLLPENLRRMQSHLVEGVSAKRANRKIGEFRCFVQYLYDTNRVNADQKRICDLIMRAVSESNDTDERGEDCFWTNDEWDRFIATFEEGDPMKVFFCVTYWGALRMGEALALRYRDFDYNKSTLSVCRSVDVTQTVTVPKNTSSNATICLRREVTDMVRRLQEEMGAGSEDLVFPGAEAEYMSRSNVRRIMNMHAEKAGVKHIKFHGLRHSMASRMVNSGLNILTVSRQLRHRNPDVTLKEYSHLFPNTDSGAIERI